MRHRTRTQRITTTAAALALLSSPALAIDWTGGSGAFGQGANWSGGSVPGPGDEALINNGGTATLASGDQEFQTLRLGVDGGSGNFVQTGGSLIAAGAFFGDTGTSTGIIRGGEFKIGGDSIHVGLSPGGVGTLTIDSPSAVVTSGDDFQLGREGTGTLNFNAGTLRAGYTVVGKFGTGIWNQTGGLFDQDFGDVEIGDGGRENQADTPGPRTGTINLSGGYMQVADHFAIGNRRGSGRVTITGGALMVDGRGDSTLYIGRGNDNPPGVGGPTSLKVTGDKASILVSGNLSMNQSDVSTKASLVANLTGPKHTPIVVGGDALIDNGHLEVELTGYTPVSGDNWTLIRTGAELTSLTSVLDAQIVAAGYDQPVHADPAVLGTVQGTFRSVTGPALPAGLSWALDYTTTEVKLRVAGTPVGLKGDFNNNQVLDAGDINLLSAEVRTGSNPASYDLNGDKLVNGSDRDVWVNDLKKTYYGDADLNGSFDSTDFVAVFQAGQYEASPGGNSVWETGDWNGDTKFDSSDFVLAFQAGGYEKGPRTAVSAVPEPGSLTLFGLAALRPLGTRRRAR